MSGREKEQAGDSAHDQSPNLRMWQCFDCKAEIPGMVPGFVPWFCLMCGKQQKKKDETPAPEKILCINPVCKEPLFSTKAEVCHKCNTAQKVQGPYSRSNSDSKEKDNKTELKLPSHDHSLASRTCANRDCNESLPSGDTEICEKCELLAQEFTVTESETAAVLSVEEHKQNIAKAVESLKEKSSSVTKATSTQINPSETQQSSDTAGEQSSGQKDTTVPETPLNPLDITGTGVKGSSSSQADLSETPPKEPPTIVQTKKVCDDSKGHQPDLETGGLNQSSVDGQTSHTTSVISVPSDNQLIFQDESRRTECKHSLEGDTAGILNMSAPPELTRTFASVAGSGDQKDAVHKNVLNSTDQTVEDPCIMEGFTTKPLISLTTNDSTTTTAPITTQQPIESSVDKNDVYPDTDSETTESEESSDNEQQQQSDGKEDLHKGTQQVDTDVIQDRRDDHLDSKV